MGCSGCFRQTEFLALRPEGRSFGIPRSSSCPLRALVRRVEHGPSGSSGLSLLRVVVSGRLTSGLGAGAGEHVLDAGWRVRVEEAGRLIAGVPERLRLASWQECLTSLRCMQFMRRCSI